uniref:Uncharacterized protein n=1 Tax=Kalanchoe fedtschenkoi TaxID=63787 RepID=A0A7N0U0J2_KALFE
MVFGCGGATSRVFGPWRHKVDTIVEPQQTLIGNRNRLQIWFSTDGSRFRCHALFARSLGQQAARAPFPAAFEVALGVKTTNNPTGSLRFPRLFARSSQRAGSHSRNAPIDRRTVALLLAGGVAGWLNLLVVGDESANAAARRPPPGPPAEKKDPNISGLAAKVLASKKRKEAMKEAIAKQRQRGKPAADAAAAAKQE